MSTTTTLRKITSADQSDKPKDAIQLLASPAVQAQIKAALPRHMTAERMARIATTELRKNPKLGTCTPVSFLGAVIQAAQIGLEPGGALGHAYILPYDVNKKQGRDWVKVTEAQLIIGYRGMIDLARRSGQILSLNATAVYEGDEFECVMGLEPSLKHVPDFNNAEREKADRLTFVYAVAKLKDGGTQFAVMSRAQVDAIRERSSGYKVALAKQKEGKKPDNPWFSDYEAMALKTVIRRLFKYLPVSIEMQQAVMLDEKADAGIAQDNGMVIEGATNFIDDDDEPPTYTEIVGLISTATDAEGLDFARGHIKDVADEKQRAELETIAAKRAGEIQQ